MSNVVHFDREFDGTDMLVREISDTARERGWVSFRIDAVEYNRTGKMMVRRVSRRDARE